MEPTVEEQMVADPEEDVKSLKDKKFKLEWGSDLVKGQYSSAFKEIEELKIEKKRYYIKQRWPVVEITQLQDQINKQKTLEKDWEHDEEKNEVDHLKSMLEYVNKRESTLKNQLKEKEKLNKWNKHNKCKIPQLSTRSIP